MKVAGRKIVESISTPAQRRARAPPAPPRRRRVTSSVLPQGCFSTMSRRPGPSLMTASPMGGGWPSTTCATSPRRSGRAAAEGDRRRARGPPGARSAPGCATARRWFGVSMKPPGSDGRGIARRRAITRVERDAVGAQALGIDEHLVLAVALAPDGDVGDAGHGHEPRTHRPPGELVSSIWESVFEETPIFITRLSGRERARASRAAGPPRAAGRPRWRAAPARAAAPGRGRCPPRRSSRPTRGRARTSSGSSSATEVPLSAFSSGTVTRLSTSVVERPGASVCTSTSGGANSGKTSQATSGIRRTPTIARAAARATTRTRCRSDARTSQDIICRSRAPSRGAPRHPGRRPCAPGAGPPERTARSPSTRRTWTRRRTKTWGAVAS